MSLIKVIGYKAVAIFLVRLLKKGKVKETAQKVGRQIDITLDQYFGEKRSERLQEKLIEVIIKFSDVLVKKLQEDWPTKGGK